MCDGLRLYFSQQFLDRIDIDLGRSQQAFAQCSSQVCEMTCQVLLIYGEYVADQRETVGMYALPISKVPTAKPATSYSSSG